MFPEIKKIERRDGYIYVDCGDGNSYKHTEEPWYDNLELGDWIITSDWEKLEK